VLGEGIVWDRCFAASVGAAHLQSIKDEHLHDKVERSGNSTVWAMFDSAYTAAATTQCVTLQTL
jgi:hypothetical protein